MSQIIRDVAEALKDRINAGSYTHTDTVTAVREYQVTYDKVDLDSVKVSVMPSERASNVATRQSSDTGPIVIDIGIRRQVTEGSVSEVDALMQLVDEIMLQVERFDPATTPPAFWIETTNVPIFDQDQLRQNVFASKLSVTYTGLT